MCHLSNLRIFQSRLLFIITLSVIFYGLFLIPGSSDSDRLWGQITNLGHIGAFLVIWTFAFNIFPRFRRLTHVQLLIVVIVLTLVIGEIIEIIQGWIGRDDEWQDVWDSCVGALLAITFCSAQVRELARKFRLVWWVVALLALAIVPWPVWSNLTDEIILRNQFPILSDFSTPFESSRWHTSNARINEQREASTGRRYLKVEFQPGHYSTVSLQYFYPDWHGYKRLIIDIRNPDKREYEIVLRMHDRLHKKHHYALNDRFNRRIVIKPGSQHFSIPLTVVKDAPATRKMDLRHMEDISLFTMNEKMNHHLDIQRVALE